MKKLLLAAALLAPATAALAHGVWIAPHYGELGVVYGMGYADDSYKPENVRFVKAYTADFKETKAEVKTHDHHSSVKVADDAAVLTAFFDNGYWEKDENGKWKAVEKSAISKPADTSTSLKYNISLLKPYQGEMKPFDLPAQIIPATDPSTLKQGDKLNVTVYVAGKPQADVEITADAQQRSQRRRCAGEPSHPGRRARPSATQRRHPFFQIGQEKINCHTAKTPRIRGVF